jgi:hypothetical protein
MTTKFVRGELIVFTAHPKDAGLDVSPASIQLYLNYKHAADGTTYTDEPLEMQAQTDGAWKANFDTAQAAPGVGYASMRMQNPQSAEDMKFTIIANAANPVIG